MNEYERERLAQEKRRDLSGGLFSLGCLLLVLACLVPILILVVGAAVSH